MLLDESQDCEYQHPHTLCPSIPDEVALTGCLALVLELIEVVPHLGLLSALWKRVLEIVLGIMFC